MPIIIIVDDRCRRDGQKLVTVLSGGNALRMHVCGRWLVDHARAPRLRREKAHRTILRSYTGIEIVSVGMDCA